MPPPAAELAWKEIRLAQKHSSGASPVERALIDALAKRYASPQPEDRTPLDRAYADAMREVWKKFPKDPDVGAFFAEAMMDLRPWDQWTPEGQPNPGTDEILAALEAVLTLNPKHPFANHLYVPKEDSLGNNSCEAILGIVTPMIEGEVLVAEGKIESGIEQLRAAIKMEDALKYDEPPGWLIPMRHSLGAVLMKQKRFAEAEQVYRDDLARLSANGWSLLGLTESLRQQKKNAEEAARTQATFEKVWAKADLKITSSCLCQPAIN